VLTAEEAERVLERPNVADPIGLRDRAILETLYSTGDLALRALVGGSSAPSTEKHQGSDGAYVGSASRYSLAGERQGPGRGSRGASRRRGSARLVLDRPTRR